MAVGPIVEAVVAAGSSRAGGGDGFGQQRWDVAPMRAGWSCRWKWKWKRRPKSRRERAIVIVVVAAAAAAAKVVKDGTAVAAVAVIAGVKMQYSGYANLVTSKRFL